MARVTSQKDPSGKQKSKSPYRYGPFPGYQAILDRRAEVAALLRENDETAQAFQDLVSAGCDEDWLRCVLLQFASKYTGRREKKRFTRRQLRYVEQVARNLKHDGNNLGEYLIVAGITHADWPVPRGQLPGLLEALGAALEASTRGMAELVIPTTSDGVEEMAAAVRKQTGREHYRQLAILLSTVSGRSMNEEQIKMICSRNRRPAEVTEAA